MEFIGKTVEDAINTALEVLNLTKDEIEISVLEEPVKGLFGRLKGKAVIDVNKKHCVKEEDVKVLEKTIQKKKEQKPEKVEKTEDKKEKAEPLSEKTLDFVQKLVDLLDMGVSVSAQKEENTIILESEQSSSVIGYRGEVLDAIQTLAGAVENIGRKNYKKVVVDCEDYREKREDTLIKLAHRLEQKATEIKREVILEPMNPYERRIIHTALSESKTVTTKSDGKEPNRYVVIVPFEKDEFSKPYNAGRNNKSNKKGGDRRNSKGSHSQKRSNGFGEKRKTTTLSFGTYLGNSLKDKN